MTTTNTGAATVAPFTYPKRVSDLLPGHIVQLTDGGRARVTYSKRVRRGVHEITLVDTDTGLATLREYPGAFEVRVVETRP